MKTILRKLLPPILRRSIAQIKLRRKIATEQQFWSQRNFAFSSSQRTDQSTQLHELLQLGHVLEKGITMPCRKLGFGQERVREVIVLAKQCIDRYGADRMEVQSALADLKQYADIHNAQFLPNDIRQGINSLMPYLTINDFNCYTLSSSELFAGDFDFAAFARKRHTVRWFANNQVNLQDLNEAVELAMTAPSACNRQATRVKIIRNREKIATICRNIQKGNRGFGDTAPVWLLITQDQRGYKYNELSLAFIDAGIFTMNLLYALHYKHLAACTLNCIVNASEASQLRELIGYSDCEIPCAFIAVGHPMPKIMIAKSRRRLPSEIITTL